MIEIERKFLVKSDAFKQNAEGPFYLIQGFLNSHADRTVRIRMTKEGGTITVKGRSSKDGTSRFEWETPLNLEEARALLKLCEPGIIEKDRYKVLVGEDLFEVDEFLGSNTGLVLAEIELPSVDAVFEKPDWLGEEVTGDVRYYNSQLSKKPFNTW